MRHTYLLWLSAIILSSVTLAGAPVEISKPTVVVRNGGYFPVLIRLHNGQLTAVLRGGAPHIGVKGRLDIVTSDDSGRSWSEPRTIVDGPQDDRNPALGQMRNGDLILAYAVLQGFDETGLKFLPDKSKRVADGVYIVRSHDGGENWTKPELSQTIHHVQLGGSVSPFGKIVQLPDGTALLSVYFQYHDDRGDQDYVFRSHDNGKTWGEPVLVGRHYNETALLTAKDATVLAAMRSEKGGRLDMTRSEDGGKTWNEPRQITADHEHPADLIRLRNGSILLSYGERNAPFGVEAVISKDGGKSWNDSEKIVLAKDAMSTDCGYPSSVQLPTGKILTMYYQVNDPHQTPGSTEARAVIWEIPKHR